MHPFDIISCENEAGDSLAASLHHLRLYRLPSDSECKLNGHIVEHAKEFIGALACNTNSCLKHLETTKKLLEKIVCFNLISPTKTKDRQTATIRKGEIQSDSLVKTWVAEKESISQKMARVY